tara:strand:+ start:17304 stop:18254 length:951 start_codon:yes stop_codon:yes gene_type:complete
MKKYNLYIYPNANPHDHDKTDFCKNTIPLSEKGIKKHFNITTAEEADFFYMGQFNNDRGDLQRYGPNDFPYFKGAEDRHICDIEGEGGFEASNRSAIPNWLHDSIITTMGPLRKYSSIKYLFTRPTFSKLLIDIVNNRNEEFSFPSEKSFGLRAFLNHKIRAATLHALHNGDFKKELHINREWQGLSKVGSSTQQDFIDTMLNNSISLCPRGSGIDSVRFLESCYYNRLPVIITDYDYILFGEDVFDTSFCHRICKKDMNPDYLMKELQKIYDMPIEQMKDEAAQGKKYFETIVREYFDDPTRYFIKWIENKKCEN